MTPKLQKTRTVTFVVSAGALNLMTALAMTSTTLWFQSMRAASSKGFSSPTSGKAKTNYVISLKVALKHFVPYLESEERVHRAFGSMTTALGNILKGLGGDLSTLLKSKKAGREARALKDTKNNEEWVGSDVWREMVLTSKHCLRCLHEHKTVPGCFTNNVHNLPNHCLSVINLSQLLSLAGLVGGTDRQGGFGLCPDVHRTQDREVSQSLEKLGAK